MNAAPTYSSAASCACLQTILGALKLANSTNPQVLQSVLLNYYDVTYFGIISFNLYGFSDLREIASFNGISSAIRQIISPLALPRHPTYTLHHMGRACLQ